MRLLLISIIGGVTIASSALAQSAPQGRVAPEPGVACPPDVRGEPPTLGGGPSSGPLSDKLAQSNGVICPPTGLDKDLWDRHRPPISESEFANHDLANYAGVFSITRR